MCACSRVECPWAVNFGVVQPGGGPLTAVVGDAPQGLLLDWTTGKVILSFTCELLDWTTGRSSCSDAVTRGSSSRRHSRRKVSS